MSSEIKNIFEIEYRKLTNLLKNLSDKENFDINPIMNKITDTDSVTYSNQLEIRRSVDPNNDHIQVLLGKTPYFNGKQSVAEQVEQYQFSANGWINKDLKIFSSEQLSDIWIGRLKSLAN